MGEGVPFSFVGPSARTENGVVHPGQGGTLCDILNSLTSTDVHMHQQYFKFFSRLIALQLRAHICANFFMRFMPT